MPDTRDVCYRVDGDSAVMVARQDVEIRTGEYAVRRILEAVLEPQRSGDGYPDVYRGGCTLLYQLVLALPSGGPPGDRTPEPAD